MKQLIILIILVSNSYLVEARPIGHIAYLGPKTENGTTGLELRQLSTKLKHKDDEVTHSVQTLSAVWMYKDPRMAAGISLSGGHRGTIEGGGQKIDGGYAALFGLFIKTKYEIQEELHLWGTLSYDDLLQRHTEEAGNHNFNMRDISFSVTTSYQASETLRPSLGIDYGSITGRLKSKVKQVNSESDWKAVDPISFHLGILWGREKFTLGLMAFTGNQSGFALQFFSTPY